MPSPVPALRATTATAVGAATTALYDPTGVAVDSSGDVFIADTDNHRVRMVPAASGSHFGQAMTRGDIYTVAGTGAACATHSPLGCGYINAGGSAQVGTAAELDDPDDVAVDSWGTFSLPTRWTPWSPWWPARRAHQGVPSAWRPPWRGTSTTWPARGRYARRQSSHRPTADGLRPARRKRRQRQSCMIRPA